MDRTQAHRADGRAVAAIRQTHPADQAALGDFFAELSAESRYLRFFGPVTPGPAMLRVLSGSADHVDAVVAERDGVIIGHAMATDGPDPRRTTEIGVVVADAWQGRGVGAALVRAVMARARARGVTSVAMDVLPGNRRVLAMITGHWPTARIGRSPDSVTISILLPHYRQHRRPTQPVTHPAVAARPAAVTGPAPAARPAAVTGPAPVNRPAAVTGPGPANRPAAVTDPAAAARSWPSPARSRTSAA